MLKTNTKTVKDRIRAYLMDCMREEDIAENATEKEIVMYVYNRFLKEADWNIPQVGRTNAFTDWLRGLALNVCFYYDEERELIRQWTDETQEEADKHDQEDVDKLYWWLLTREFFALVRKFRIDKEEF